MGSLSGLVPESHKGTKPLSAVGSKVGMKQSNAPKHGWITNGSKNVEAVMLLPMILATYGFITGFVALFSF